MIDFPEIAGFQLAIHAYHTGWNQSCQNKQPEQAWRGGVQGFESEGLPVFAWLCST
jgi:hypothetical protein